MSQQTSQESVNGDTPSVGYLTVGITLCIALVWTTIWLAEILLGGCNPSPATAVYDDKTSTQQILQDQRRLDALLISLTKQQNN